jgi:hypothetical protein
MFLLSCMLHVPCLAHPWLISSVFNLLNSWTNSATSIECVNRRFGGSYRFHHQVRKIEWCMRTGTYLPTHLVLFVSVQSVCSRYSYRLLAGRPRNQVQVLARIKYFSLLRNVQTGSWTLRDSCPVGIGSYFLGGQVVGTWIWSYLYLVPRLKMHGSVPQLPNIS